MCPHLTGAFSSILILTSAINIMLTFVHNEPTSLSVLQEAKLPDAFYDAVEQDIEPSLDVSGLVFTVAVRCRVQPDLPTDSSFMHNTGSQCDSNSHRRALSQRVRSQAVH